MNFTQAITAGFRNYVNFTGRASRSEFWFWVLFYVLVAIAALLIDLVLFADTEMTPLNSLAGLALFLPYLSVLARRLHDIDRSGWWIFLYLIPLVGMIIILIWNCTKGTAGPNRFGPDPLAGMA